MFEASPEMLSYISAFIGIFLAIVIRTLWPYLQKLEENPGMAFRWIFVVNAMMSGFVASIAMILAFPMPNEPFWKIMILAFTFAFTTNEFLNLYMKGKGTATVNYATKEVRKQRKIIKLEKRLNELKKVENR